MFAKTTPNRTTIALFALILVAPILAACGLLGGPAVETDVVAGEEAPAEQQFAQEAPARDAEVAAPEEPMEEAAPSAEYYDGDEVGASAASEGLGGADDAAEMPALAPEAEGEFRELSESEPAAADAVVEAEESFAPSGEAVAQAPIALQAGEIDDNRQWDDYLLYRRDFLSQGWLVHDVDVAGRHIINVETAEGFPVLGARVRIFDGQRLVSESRTYATGQTLFHPNADPRSAGVDSFNVVVEKGGDSAEFTLNTRETNEWFVTLREAEPVGQRVRLDVLFLIDATGSMADEIEQLQSNILAISEQIDALPSRPDTRYGMVTYRDRTDDYVTRVYDFTPDVRDFQDDLSGVRAAGGDDYPESLNEALYDAVHRPEWRVEDTVSLVFLVADAPPHLDYANDRDYAEEMVEAARLGIKIHPIASSGLEPQGEYIFRQIAQHTMGHFIFLTYEQEQGDYGRPELAAGGEDYTVDALDQLVLRLIEDELAALHNQ